MLLDINMLFDMFNIIILKKLYINEMNFNLFICY